MGVVIRAVKIGKQITRKEYESRRDNGDEGVVEVYSIDFHPIVHLPSVKAGCYEVEGRGKSELSMCCSYYSRNFRDSLCRLVLEVPQERVFDDIIYYLGKPFVELINFADNEGCFDYKIAKKLLKDFEDYDTFCKVGLSKELYRIYCVYKDILKEAVSFKGVVEYR